MISAKKTSTLAGALVALALAGCGGSSHSAASVTAQTGPSGGSGVQTTSTSAATTSTTTTTTATATTTTGATPTSGACTAGDLTPDFVGSNAATGHVVLAIALHNTSSGTCHTYGYPGVQFRASGSPIPTNAQRVTQDFAGNVPLAHITLKPGQWTSFRIVTDDVSSNACQSADSLQIIAPDDTATMNVSIPNAVSVCGGKATVSPLQPGMRANTAGHGSSGGGTSTSASGGAGL